MKLNRDISVVWIATHPRTGSMWTTNVVREIVRSEGIDIPPAPWRMVDEDIVRLGVAHIQEGRPGIAVLKCHHIVPRLPRSAGITTQRDVRDTVISYMRFMRAPFEQALLFAQMALRSTPQTLFEGEHHLVLPYTTIADRPAEAVRSIAEFLGAETALGQSEEIAAKFTKAQVERRIAAAQERVAASLLIGAPVDPDRIAVFSPQHWRARDPATDFQTGHISDYREGDWRTILTPAQQEKLNQLIEAAGRSLV